MVERLDADDPDLSAVYAELPALLLGSPDPHRFLASVAQLAAAVVRPRASVGVTLQSAGPPTSAGASDELAAEVDDLQHSAGQGPCLQAVLERSVVEVPDLQRERRWAAFRGAALEQGVRSVLAVPLVVDQRAVGALNLYATDPDGLAGQTAEVCRFAEQASAVLTVVLRQADAARLEGQLRQAISSRDVVGQAVGILMTRHGCSPETALATLRSRSQTRNVKLRDVAAALVAQVSGDGPQPPSG